MDRWIMYERGMQHFLVLYCHILLILVQYSESWPSEK